MLGRHPGVMQMQFQPPIQHEYARYEGLRSLYLNELNWAQTDGEVEWVFHQWRDELNQMLAGGFINPAIHGMEMRQLDTLERVKLKEVRGYKAAESRAALGSVPGGYTIWVGVAIAVVLGAAYISWKKR